MAHYIPEYQHFATTYVFFCTDGLISGGKKERKKRGFAKNCNNEKSPSKGIS